MYSLRVNYLIKMHFLLSTNLDVAAISGLLVASSLFAATPTAAQPLANGAFIVVRELQVPSIMVPPLDLSAPQVADHFVQLTF